MDEEGRKEQGIQTENTEPQKMTVSGSININNKTKPTALVKRKKETLIKCKAPRDKRFELHWDYTTSKSGSQEFTFTGKEMGEGFWSPEEKNKLKIGDLVIFKKKGHQNNKYKARIYAKTGLISKLDALKNGIIQELPKIPDLYDIKFIAPPVINGERKLKMKGISKENLEKIPGYRFFFCGTAKPNEKNGESYKEPDFKYNKERIKSLVKLEMKKGFVKKLPWKIDMIEARHTDVKKDPITGKNVPPEKIIDTPKNLNFQIAGVELIEVSNPICINKGKEKETHKLRAKVHLRLVKVEKGKPVGDYDGVMSVLDCKEHKRRALVKLQEIKKDFSDQAIDFADYIGDKLDRKYAKNQYGEMKWFQNKGKQEHLATIARNKKRKGKVGDPEGEEETEPTETQKAKETIKEWKNEGKADAHAETQRLKSSMGALKKGLEIEKGEKEEEDDAKALATEDSDEHTPPVASIGGGKRKMSRRKKNKKRSCTKKNRRNRNK